VLQSENVFNVWPSPVVRFSNIFFSMRSYHSIIMAGKKKGTSRRRHGADSSSDDEKQSYETNDVSSSRPSNKAEQDFSQRREAQRRAAAEKRRTKMKCHLCGESGHVRRECPGIADDGRGESRHKNAKGDKNARRKASDAGGGKKGARNRGRKSSSKKYDEVRELVLPPGFEAWLSPKEDDDDEPLKYFDAGCDPSATIEYLRFGRGKAKRSKREAVEEYHDTICKVVSESNYGGSIVRCAIEADRSWQPENATCIESLNASNTWFVLGFGSAADCDAGALSGAISSNKRRVVGVYADLDYPKGMSADDQRNRLETTIKVAAEESIPIQIRTPPLPSNEDCESTGTLSYANAIVDLGKILLDAIRQYPTLKVHLSCWTGRSEHLTALLNAFPDNIVVGFDGTVTFAKATALHECVFDVPLTKILLETGSPRTIPSVATKTQGREAFAHSGLVPFIADAIATQKKTDAMTAETVARIASENFIKLYSPTFSDE